VTTGVLAVFLSVRAVRKQTKATGAGVRQMPRRRERLRPNAWAPASASCRRPRVDEVRGRSAASSVFVNLPAPPIDHVEGASLARGTSVPRAVESHGYAGRCAYAFSLSQDPIPNCLHSRRTLWCVNLPGIGQSWGATIVPPGLRAQALPVMITAGDRCSRRSPTSRTRATHVVALRPITGPTAGRIAGPIRAGPPRETQASWEA
jgi:hypothetical protein